MAGAPREMNGVHRKDSSDRQPRQQGFPGPGRAGFVDGQLDIKRLIYMYLRGRPAIRRGAGLHRGKIAKK